MTDVQPGDRDLACELDAALMSDLVGAVRAVLALHKHDGTGWCSHCSSLTEYRITDRGRWPCLTLRRLIAALADSEDPR